MGPAHRSRCHRRTLGSAGGCPLDHGAGSRASCATAAEQTDPADDSLETRSASALTARCQSSPQPRGKKQGKKRKKKRNEAKKEATHLRLLHRQGQENAY